MGTEFELPGYDNWKLATPPNYELDEDDEDCEDEDEDFDNAYDRSEDARYEGEYAEDREWGNE